MSEWKTIDSAPKDGTVILGYDPSWYEIAVPMFWNKRRQQFEFYQVSNVIFATHWRPMLALPGENDEQ